MYNKITLASAMLCGLAAAADKGYTGTCKFASLGSAECPAAQGYLKLRQEPGSDVITRKFYFTGLDNEELTWLGIFPSGSAPLTGWFQTANDFGTIFV